MGVPWENDSGQPIVDADGKIIECDDCPCSLPPEDCADLLDNFLGSRTINITINGATWSTFGCAATYNSITGLTEFTGDYDPGERRVWGDAGFKVSVVIRCFDTGSVIVSVFIFRDFIDGCITAQWEDQVDIADVQPGDSVILPLDSTNDCFSAFSCYPTNSPTCTVEIV